MIQLYSLIVKRGVSNAYILIFFNIYYFTKLQKITIFALCLVAENIRVEYIKAECSR